MRKLVIATLLLFSIHTFGQIGINTEKPQTDLDINGDITIRGPLKLGTTANPGKAGDVVVSQGLKAPNWQSLPSVQTNIGGTYLLTDVVAKKTTKGINLPTDQGSFAISENMPLANSKWIAQEDSEFSFEIKKDNSFIFISLQTTAQSTIPSIKTTVRSPKPEDVAASSVTFAGGIFLLKENEENANFKLIATRQGTIHGVAFPSSVFSIFYTINNLKKGTYRVIAAFARTKSNGILTYYDVNIGGNSTPASNVFMTKTVLQTQIYSPKSSDI